MQNPYHVVSICDEPSRIKPANPVAKALDSIVHRQFASQFRHNGHVLTMNPNKGERAVSWFFAGIVNGDSARQKIQKSLIKFPNLENIYHMG